MGEFIELSWIWKLLRGRFLYLLISLLCVIALGPFLEEFVALGALGDLFVVAVLLSGIFAVSPKKYHRFVVTLLALPMLASLWLTPFVESRFLMVTGTLFAVLFFAYSIILILSFVFKAEVVTADVIHGAVVAYLLMGVMWGFLFFLLELVHQGSFSIAAGTMEDIRQSFIYFSFVTLTTLGYGDIAPLTAQARSLAVIEAVIGQVYLTVLIAQLVGMHISQSIEGKSE